MSPCRSTRKCRQDHKIYRAFRTKEEICKNRVAAQKEMLKIREEIDRTEERFRQLSDKVDKEQNG